MSGRTWGAMLVRAAWRVGTILVSLLFMTSHAVADSLCPDIDRVVQLAPSGFRSIVDEADRGVLTTAVTYRLPGASRCWLYNSERAYWCSWPVASEEVTRQVERLADAIGQCYQARPDYDSDYGDAEPIAFIDLPNSVSIYITGERYDSVVTISIGAKSPPTGDSSGGEQGAVEAP
jgi:hypothetical protein